MRDLTRRGLAAAVGASIMMAVMGTCVKLASHEISNHMVVFIRNACGLMILLPGLMKLGQTGMRTERFGAHLVRSLAGLGAMYCFFYAIARMHLAEAVLLNFSSPVFTALLAAVWLKEALTRTTVMAVALGLAGIACILKPVPSHFTTVSLVGLASAMLAALAMVNVRALSATDPTLRIVLYFSIVSTVVSSIPLPWYWQTPSGEAALAMVGAGLCASVGQLLLTYAYSTSAAAKVGTLTYSTVVFAAIFGWLFWSEEPDALSVLGASLIFLAGVLVTQRSAAEAD